MRTTLDSTAAANNRRTSFAALGMAAMTLLTLFAMPARAEIVPTPDYDVNAVLTSGYTIFESHVLETESGTELVLILQQTFDNGLQRLMLCRYNLDTATEVCGYFD
ncbi:MAG: hypothetical protein ACFCVH_10240 [Alphaproteobacteria bacterium]